MPEYTLSLLFWIIPLVFIFVLFSVKKIPSPIVKKALLINLVTLTSVGFVLDLLFAEYFFTFPNKDMILGYYLFGIPIEEFAFYLFGFWFIILFYVINDEWFLSRYNVDERRYSRYAKSLSRFCYFKVSPKQFLNFVIWCVLLFAIKKILNPGQPIPGYALFLTVAAYAPFLLFWRLTRRFVNKRAMVFTLMITISISIIWEVTLAIPRGYWGYQSDFMLGLFFPAWHHLPIEAVSVWAFSSLIILSYEYTKLRLHRSMP